MPEIFFSIVLSHKKEVFLLRPIFTIHDLYTHYVCISLHTLVCIPQEKHGKKARVVDDASVTPEWIYSLKKPERSEKIAIILIKRKKEIPSFIIILVDEKRKSCIIYATNGCSLYYYNLRVEMDNVVLSKLQQSLQYLVLTLRQYGYMGGLNIINQASKQHIKWQKSKEREHDINTYKYINQIGL